MSARAAPSASTLRRTPRPSALSARLDTTDCRAPAPAAVNVMDRQATTKTSSATMAARTALLFLAVLHEMAAAEQALVTAWTALRAVTFLMADAPSAKPDSSRQAPTKTPATNATQASISRRRARAIALTVRQARLLISVQQRGRPPAWRVLRASTRQVQMWRHASFVLQARLRTRAACQVLVPAPNAPWGSSQQLLRQAPAPSVLPGTSSPPLAKLCAPNATAARRAHDKRVVAQPRATALTAFPASMPMRRHRHALTAPQATNRRERMQLRVRRAKQATTKARTGSHSACRVRQARSPTLARRRGRPPAWCVLQASTQVTQVLHSASHVWRARSRTRAVSQVPVPAPNA
jgi:hypothetical protein